MRPPSFWFSRKGWAYSFMPDKGLLFVSSKLGVK